MDDTVLQQGDQIGTTGDTGGTGQAGATGAQGNFTNVLSVELVYTFTPTVTPSAVALATTYVVEAGTTGFWKASGVHSYVNAAFTDLPAITTLTNFLETTSKKFSTHIQLTQTKILDSVGTVVLLPDRISTIATAEIYNTSDDNIVIRFIHKTKNLPITFRDITSYKVRKLIFSLLIIGED